MHRIHFKSNIVQLTTLHCLRLRHYPYVDEVKVHYSTIRSFKGYTHKMLLKILKIRYATYYMSTTDKNDLIM